MKIGVTGAAGFVGTNLIDALVAEGHDVVAIDRVRNPRVQSDQVGWVEGDVLNPDSMRRALEGVEQVYHLVAMITLRMEDPLAWRVNTEGVRHVAEAALAVGARRFVHVSSVHSFDQEICGPVLDETSPRSERPEIPVYDRSKWAGEQELRKVIDKGLDATICNPTGIWGPVEYATGKWSRLNGIARDAARGLVPAFISDAAFDIVDVRDVVAGAMLAAEKGRTGENYLLGGDYRPLIQWVRLNARVAGRRGPRIGFPLSLLSGIMPVAEPICAALGSDVLSQAMLNALSAAPRVDYSKAKHELGYEPHTLEQSVRDFVSFLIQSGQMDR
ncbi:NAD-dependent epimerase/dehydratase family protein [Nocardia tengchongensis]|uniref:NAD-dependent epimerase/dehydratase family protein n=1 Tax=Nocardia tengchongensis TaxID=2055889 RepID=UPI00369C6A10